MSRWTISICFLMFNLDIVLTFRGENIIMIQGPKRECAQLEECTSISLGGSYFNFRKAQMKPREHRNRLSIKHTNARYDIGFTIRCWRNWLGEKHTHIHKFAYLSANNIWDVSLYSKEAKLHRICKRDGNKRGCPQIHNKMKAQL